MCQLWALHVLTKRQFFYIYSNIWVMFLFSFEKYLLFSRDETPTVEQTQAFVDVCETFIRRNPLHAIGRLWLCLDFCLQKSVGLNHGQGMPVTLFTEWVPANICGALLIFVSNFLMKYLLNPSVFDTPSPPLDSIWAMMIVYMGIRKENNQNCSALYCV